MKRIAKGLLPVVLVLGFGAWLWLGNIENDEGISRPRFESFTMGVAAADGSTVPPGTGFVRDAAGNGYILPPMTPEKPLDIHTLANRTANHAIRSCFWPGPRARPGVFTARPDSEAMENQFTDTGTTYIPTALVLPAGAKLILRGEFPRMRHWNFNSYDADGVPQDALNDFEIEPDPGSVNPFRDGAARDAAARRYTLTIASGAAPVRRAANTLYTNVPAGAVSFLYMRNYVPDGSKDYLGGAGLPQIELQFADGTVLPQDRACAATATPERGRQLARTVNPKMWLALTRMPWVDGANIGASRDEVTPFRAFFNRQQVLASLFFPTFASDTPEAKGGWWSNMATRYGYLYFSRNFGNVYLLTGKLPRTPQTWHGGKSNDSKSVDMRYTSFCANGAPPSGLSVDCLYDEQLLPTLDPAGHFYIVMSRPEDRPANARGECGVAWLNYGNGDGLAGGSPEFASVINRQTIVNPAFRHSWFAVGKPGDEVRAMGDYLPRAINFKDKARFEALGCPVDKTRIASKLR